MLRIKCCVWKQASWWVFFCLWLCSPFDIQLGIFVSDLEFLNFIFMFKIVTWLKSQNHMKDMIRDFTCPLFIGRQPFLFLFFLQKSWFPLSSVIKGGSKNCLHCVCLASLFTTSVTVAALPDGRGVVFQRGLGSAAVTARARVGFYLRSAVLGLRS